MEFVKGKTAAEIYGIPDDLPTVRVINGEGDSIRIPREAIMILPGKCGESTELTSSYSNMTITIGWDDYKNILRAWGYGLVYADGVVWKWSLGGIFGERYSDYLKRMADSPRTLHDPETIGEFKIPLNATACTLKSLLGSGEPINLIETPEDYARSTTDGGLYALHFYGVYWYWEVQ